MTDYGHELKFGTFITPTSANPRHVVELAELSDRLGVDLITFQDHPYQPALLDAWSLLAYVAARTEHAHVSANVTNLPLRQPVVIARSSVTIGQLGGGRARACRHPVLAQRQPRRLAEEYQPEIDPGW